MTFHLRRSSSLMLSLGITVAGAASMSLAQPPTDPSNAAVAPAEVGSEQWIDQKIEANQPTAAERKFDRIGWVTDITTAKALAKKHKRPVFLFTHDGRIATGRC